MHTGLMLILLVSLVVPANHTPVASTFYHVDEVVRVISPNSFECKLSNYHPAPNVRFRVTLPGLDAGISQELLAGRLESAKQIELRNVKFRNYFRVQADLYLDDKDFRETAGNVKSAALTVNQASGKQPDLSAVWSGRRKLPKPGIEVVPSVTGEPVTLRKLLDTSVDCSMLNTDTPLSEALDMLAEMVEPRLPLVILWSDLQANAMVDKDTTIGIDGLKRMTVRQALDSIMQSLGSSGVKLVLIAEGKILTLGTEQTLAKDKSTEVFPIQDLLQAPSRADEYY